jgi:hypothetical protein
MPLAITTISPNSGLTKGRDLVTITGTDFDLHPFPPTLIGQPLGKPSPSVKVLFGGVECTDVSVYSSTEIVCVLPAFKGDPKTLPAPVNVSVQNLLTPPYPTVVAANGFTYQTPDYTQQVQVDLERCTKGILRELRRRLGIPVLSRVHTDYDASTGDSLQTVELAKLPSLQVTGPNLSRSAGIWQNRQPRYSAGFRLRQPTRYDLDYSLRVFDDSSLRLHRIVNEMLDWQDENFYCLVEMPSGQEHPFRLQWSQLPQVEATGGRDNLCTATASLTLIGVGLERLGTLKLHEVNTPQSIEVWVDAKV